MHTDQHNPLPNLPTTGYNHVLHSPASSKTGHLLQYGIVNLLSFRERLLAQYGSHSHCMPPGVHVLAPPAREASH
jgi:hypothetical protein